MNISVTVFVRDIGDGFAASTYRTDAFAGSKELAAKRAASRFFDAPIEQIALLDDPADPHVFTAVKVDAAHPGPALLSVAVAILCVTAVLCGAILIAGGCR